MSAAPDLHNTLKFVNMIGPNASTTGDTAVVSTIVDRQGYESMEIVVHTGNLDDANATFAVTLEHGDNSALSDAAVPVANDLIGTLAADMNFAFGDDNSIKRVGYKGAKRYVRATITPTGNSAAAGWGMMAILGHARHNPPGGTF